MIPGDEYHPFDPNAFVDHLVAETGITHVWEPVRTKVAEGGRCIITHSLEGHGGQSPDYNAPLQNPSSVVGDLEPVYRLQRVAGPRG